MATTTNKITVSSLQSKKERGQKICMLTAYDYPTAALQDEAGLDVILVGDSVGTNVLGYRGPQQVTMDDILHHLRAVRRAVRRAFLLADLPFMSYQPSVETAAMDNAARSSFRKGGAEGVKIRGRNGRSCPRWKPSLPRLAFPPWDTSGFTPQSQVPAGSISTASAAARCPNSMARDRRGAKVIARAKHCRLEDSGVFSLVLGDGYRGGRPGRQRESGS